MHKIPVACDPGELCRLTLLDVKGLEVRIVSRQEIKKATVQVNSESTQIDVLQLWRSPIVLVAFKLLIYSLDPLSCDIPNYDIPNIDILIFLSAIEGVIVTRLERGTK